MLKNNVLLINITILKHRNATQFYMEKITKNDSLKQNAHIWQHTRPPTDNISAQLSLKAFGSRAPTVSTGEFIAMCSHPSCFAAGKEARVRGR